MQVLADRREAGAQLAGALRRFADAPDAIVLALPRGGVPVGYEIATRLGLPLDVLVVRKLGVPGREEIGMGAIASGDIEVRNELASRVSHEQFDAVVRAEKQELARREHLFRGHRAPLDVRGKTVLLVDDGLATGSTMLAAIEALRTREPAEIVAAVPVAPPQTCETLRDSADEVVCLLTPQHLYAVGVWYKDFTQTTDDEVRDLLFAADQSFRISRRSNFLTGAVDT